MTTLSDDLMIKSLREDLAILRKDLKRITEQRDDWKSKYKKIRKINDGRAKA